MRCEAFEELIDGADLTAEEEHARLISHAQDCPRCREELNKSRKLHYLLRNAFTFCPDHSYWEGYSSEVGHVAKMRALEPPEPTLWQRWRALMCWPFVGETPAFLIPILIVGMAVAGILWMLDR